MTTASASLTSSAPVPATAAASAARRAAPTTLIPGMIYGSPDVRVIQTRDQLMVYADPITPDGADLRCAIQDIRVQDGIPMRFRSEARRYELAPTQVPWLAEKLQERPEPFCQEIGKLLQQGPARPAPEAPAVPARTAPEAPAMRNDDTSNEIYRDLVKPPATGLRKDPVEIAAATQRITIYNGPGVPDSVARLTSVADLVKNWPTIFDT